MNPAKKIALSLSLIVGLSTLIFLWNPERAESESTKQHFWTAKTHSIKKQDIVAYGDSRVYRGFSTKAFLGKQDLSCHNYGYSSGSYSKLMLEFCEGQLKPNGKGIYLFGITPHSFTKSAIMDEHFKQEYERSSIDIETRLAKTQVLQYFDPISAEDLLGLSSETETFHPDGWVSKSNVVFDTLSGLNSYTKTFSETEIDIETYDNFFIFVKEQSDKGRKVFAYRPPTMISMDALEEELTSFRFSDFIGRFEAAGGSWVEVPRTDFETYDGSHLTTESTIKLSEFLRKQILIF